jgi:TPR repeat protein
VKSRSRGVYDRFIALLKAQFKFYADDRTTSGTGVGTQSRSSHSGALHRAGEAKMGRTEFAAIENGSIGEASDELFFRLGMMYSTGAEVPTDYVSAHKWFNLAAMRGNAEAIRLRREVAEEMSEAEIAQAQRAARDWLKH